MMDKAHFNACYPINRRCIFITGMKKLLSLLTAALLLLGGGAAAQAEPLFDIPQLYIAPVVTADGRSLETAVQYPFPHYDIEMNLYPLESEAGVPWLYATADNDAWKIELLDDGSLCCLLDAFIDGHWHYVLCDDRIGYVKSINLDLSDADVDYVFVADQDMRTKTGYSAEELEKCLSGRMCGLGEAFAQAEDDWHVNALFMIAICQLEAGPDANSGLAVSRNNMAGMQGSGGYMYYDSLEACIDYLAKRLSQDYLRPGSSYYHGSTINGVCVTYCNSSAHWINSVTRYMQKDFDKINAPDEE